MIECKDVRVAYGDTVIVDSLDLKVEQGELLCIVGPSGCGKSTLLRAIGGLADVGGTIVVDGRDRALAWDSLSYVFQQPRLLRWRTAINNVILGMQLRDGRRDKSAMRAEARPYLDQVGLGELAERRGHMLSGGEQQRVSLARALALQPKVLMMDEPFSALDVTTRHALRDELIRIWRDTGLTVLFVTHDVDEAIYVGSRVIVFSKQPTHVLADVQIDLQHPRNMESAEFRELHDDVVHHFGGMSQL